MSDSLKSFEEYVSQNEIEYCRFDFYPGCGEVIVEANHATRLEGWQELVNVDLWRDFVSVAGKFAKEIYIDAYPSHLTKELINGFDLNVH